MNFDDLASAIRSELTRIVKQRIAAPAALAAASKPGGMGLENFISAAAGGTRWDASYGHLLGAPASRAATQAWRAEHPSHPLPNDLAALVERANGIHLWANIDTGRSYVGLAPIEEWDIARIKMYGQSGNPVLLDDRYVAISYHQDGASFLVLDVESGRYFLMDAAGPDTSTPIAKNVEELLDWLWRNRIAPTL
jgi:hypothetical protein